MKNFYLIVFFLCAILSIKAQNQYENIDNKMDAMPIELEDSTDKIVSYINDNFTTNNDKIRAAFYWTAATISYDVENILKQKPNQSPEYKITNTLKSKKGICMHYAEIFSDIANKLGIKTIQISGYTKDVKGKITPLSHAWCASFIDGNWFLMDPTWGSGYVEKDKYIKKLNNNYFKAIPNSLISTHMPFDFLWQFSDNPISNQEFYDGITESATKTEFNFLKEIDNYEKASPLEKSIGAAERIKKNGLKNKLIIDYYNFEKVRTQYINQNSSIVKFTDIVTRFNESNRLHNEFIKYRNNKFTPIESDEQIKNKIQEPYDMLLQCQKDLLEIKDFNRANQGTIVSLKKAMENAKTMLAKSLKYTNDYLAKTNEVDRKKTFYTIIKTR